MKRTPLVIDTDPGKDDALAIMLAALSDTIEIKAITTVMGNCGLEDATSNALTILDLLPVSVPIYSGAAAPLARPFEKGIVMGTNGLEGINRLRNEPLNGLAVTKIKELVFQFPKELTILAIGPLTNLATAFETFPEIIPLIKQVVIMGGATNYIGNSNPVAEFNFYTDPEAADIVIRSSVKKVLIPLEICYQVPLMKTEFEQLQGSTLYQPVIDLMLPYIDMLAEFEGQAGAIAYDALAAYFLINPAAFTLTSMSVQVETQGELTRGMIVVERRAIKKDATNVEVVTGLQIEVFKQDFFNILRKNW